MIPFVGGSYKLDFLRADVQRSVNLYPTVMESGTGKAPAILKSIPGYSLFATPGSAIRGIHEAHGRCFVAAGSTLYELDSTGTATSRGTLSTSSGRVEMADGLLQLVVVDGSNGYVLTLSSNAFASITSSGWRGSNRVWFLDGYFIFVDPGTQQFYWSAIDDASTLDALDFASAESSPDDVVAHLVDHRDLMLLGEKSTEGWRNTGSDAVFERNEGAIMEVGCAAAFSAQKLDSTFLWVGNDKNGDGVVWMADGYKPRPVSNDAVSQALQASPDISGCVAYTYQMDGHSFYCLNIPGHDTTVVFDVKTGQWHDRAELVNGEFEQIRGTCHAYCFGKHLIGADDGKVYWLDKTKNTLNGDTLCRERTSPHEPKPASEPALFSSFTLNCDVGNGKPDGTAPSVQFQYSNDYGNTWSQWKTASLGAIGEFATNVVFRRLGYVPKGGGRVWRVRCTDDTPFSIIEGVAA